MTVMRLRLMLEKGMLAPELALRRALNPVVASDTRSPTSQAPAITRNARRAMLPLVTPWPLPPMSTPVAKVTCPGCGCTYTCVGMSVPPTLSL